MWILFQYGETLPDDVITPDGFSPILIRFLSTIRRFLRYREPLLDDSAFDAPNVEHVSRHDRKSDYLVLVVPASTPSCSVALRRLVRRSAHGWAVVPCAEAGDRVDPRLLNATTVLLSLRFPRGMGLGFAGATVPKPKSSERIEN